jgi:hypothetical protein
MHFILYVDKEILEVVPFPTTFPVIFLREFGCVNDLAIVLLHEVKLNIHLWQITCLSILLIF